MDTFVNDEKKKILKCVDPLGGINDVTRKRHLGTSDVRSVGTGLSLKLSDVPVANFIVT